jgi:hypothetical protein
VPVGALETWRAQGCLQATSTIITTTTTIPVCENGSTFRKALEPFAQTFTNLQKHSKAAHFSMHGPELSVF